jgi:hypothetical protein
MESNVIAGWKATNKIGAAADFLGNGAIEINKYEDEIFDLVRRMSVFLQRVDRKPANGHPHRYFEETAIGVGAFTDPRNITPTPTGPTRVERPAFIKAITAQTNFSLFDVDTTRQQGQFAAIEAKDIADITNSIIVTSAQAVWAGTDTSLSLPTTVQYVGLLTQITTQSVIGPGASIIDGIKSQVAELVAQIGFVVRPSAIWVNPVLGDYIDREAKASQITFDKVEIVGGVQVSSIQTQAGMLPLISDPYIPTTPVSTAAFGFSATPANFKGYYAIILMESAVEMPVIHGGDGNLMPRLFQLGLLSGLQGQYVGVMFDAIIAKGANYAHATIQVQRT